MMREKRIGQRLLFGHLKDGVVFIRNNVQQTVFYFQIFLSAFELIFIENFSRRLVQYINIIFFARETVPANNILFIRYEHIVGHKRRRSPQNFFGDGIKA